MSFSLDLSAFTKKAGANADLVVKRVVAGMAESVIEMSPVGDGAYWKHPPPKGYVGGRFRANWDYGFNEIPRAVFDTVDKTGGVALRAINAKLRASSTDGIHYLANNLPYAQRIEDGWSRQAPVGVVGVTTFKFQRLVREAVQ